MDLTGRDKAIAILRGERFDTPALYACMTSDPLVEALTGKKLEKDIGFEVLGEAYRGHVDAVRLFGETIEPYWNEGESTDDRGFVRRRERWTEWCRRRPYANVDELAAFIKDEIDAFRAWEPAGEEEAWLDHCERIDAHLRPDVLFMGRSQAGTAPGSYFRDGLELFSYLLAERPSLVQNWLEARHERTLKRIPLVAHRDKCPVEFIDSDMAYKTGLLVSPAYLRRSGWFKRVAEIVEVYHGVGVKLIFHSDGDLREILPELAATGIDGLNPIETSAGLTLQNVRALAGDDLLLVGGIPSDVLVHGTPDDVRSCVRGLVRQMKGTPWWAGTSTEEFDESMPVENALAVIEETGHAI